MKTLFKATLVFIHLSIGAVALGACYFAAPMLEKTEKGKK